MITLQNNLISHQGLYDYYKKRIKKIRYEKIKLKSF